MKKRMIPLPSYQTDYDFLRKIVVGTYFDYVIKYVLWDDVLDWVRDIKDYGKKKRLHL